MPGAMSEGENAMFGALCGCIETTLLQSTNYWKNAAQQGLPFTLNPSVLYRGYVANLFNNGAATSSQFFFGGLIKKSMTGGADRPLTGSETITAAVGAGVLSGPVCSPIELVMIQQQRKGGSLFGTAAELARGGHLTRGTTGMMLREGSRRRLCRRRRHPPLPATRPGPAPPQASFAAATWA